MVVSAEYIHSTVDDSFTGSFENSIVGHTKHAFTAFYWHFIIGIINETLNDGCSGIDKTTRDNFEHNNFL